MADFNLRISTEIIRINLKKHMVGHVVGSLPVSDIFLSYSDSPAFHLCCPKRCFVLWYFCYRHGKTGVNMIDT